MITKDMQILCDKLFTIEVKNIVAAYDYLGEQINEMDFKGTYGYKLNKESNKNIMKEYKLLKKYYKGKITIDPKAVYSHYPKDSNEYFFLKCLVTIMDNNKL